MSARVLVTDYAWPTLAIERTILGEVGAELVVAESGDAAELIALAAGADAILINWRQLPEEALDAATGCLVVARYGVGVIMPFEINQDWDLTNPNVRQSILDHVSAWVERYKDHPAVRIWAPGNENIHRILYPRWVSQENEPVARARADAFAAFLPLLVDRIHQLDPKHPVLYRDAEDVYLRSLKTALEANGETRPWLLYGANVYSPTRLKQIVDAWPAQWLAGPLLISEFAPGGVGRGIRQSIGGLRSTGGHGRRPERRGRPVAPRPRGRRLRYCPGRRAGRPERRTRRPAQSRPAQPRPKRPRQGPRPPPPRAHLPPVASTTRRATGP